METVVIKYYPPEELKQKYQTSFLIGLIEWLVYQVIKMLTLGIFKGKSDYERHLGNIEYWYIEIQRETGIPLREIGFDVTNRALLFAEKGLNKGLWTDSTITLDYSQFPPVDREVFCDIFEVMEIRDMRVLTRKVNKYFQRWTSNKNVKAIELPLLIFDLNNSSEVFYCGNIDLLRDVDITGYEWESGKRAIDVNGNIYKTTYINFGHPVGRVYPEIIERTITPDEFKDLFKESFLSLKAETFEDLFIELEYISR